MRILSRLLVLIAAGVLAGCATPPKHFPSETATSYVGRPLLDLEMHWSTPSDLGNADGGQAATWRFDEYNLAGCTVTVRTDPAGTIRKVAWTRGCGPKGTGTPAPAAIGAP